MTASAVTAGAAPTISLAVSGAHAPTGNVSYVVTKAGQTVASGSSPAGAITLPALDAGTYAFTLTYPGDYNLAPFTESGTLTVNPAPVVVTPITTTPVVITPISKPVVVLAKAGV